MNLIKDKIVVMLATEGTYPFHQGGVSTWCDILVQELKSVDYVIYSVLMDPFVTQKFKLPEPTELIKMPLWGTEEPSEHLHNLFSQNYLAKMRTSKKAINEHFIPLFTSLIEEIISSEKDPVHFSQILLELHLYFQQYDYKLSFKSEETWNTFKQIILQKVAENGSQLARPDIYCLIQSLGWIYRFLNILNTPIPESHVTHSSAAAFCSIPCVLAKLKNKTPFMLTEHGIYLREQYLSLAKREYSSFLNTFLIRMVHSVNSMNYTFADQVSPVCQYNTRWELEFGVQPKKIDVIYNGVNKEIFLQDYPRSRQAEPTVVTVARIDPLKDIMTLIRTAAVVKSTIPNVKFIVYGSVSVPAYYEECLALRASLELNETVIFAGHTTNMAAAYQSGDIVALTSISEAFPYSVVEAMMSGKAVISTDVGGIREAIGEAGIMTAPRDYQKMGEGIIKLLSNPELRESIGQEGKERALSYFTLEKVLDLHLKSYMKLALAIEERVPTHDAAIAVQYRKRQRLHMERGYALLSAGFYEDAISQFRLAVNEAPSSPTVPVLLLEIAQIYNELGQFDLAFHEIEKYEIWVDMIENQKLA